MEYSSTGEQESEFGNSNGVLQQEEKEAGSDNSEVMRGEDGVELSQFYINEIRKQLEVGIYTSKHPQCQSQKQMFLQANCTCSHIEIHTITLCTCLTRQLHSINVDQGPLEVL